MVFAIAHSSEFGDGLFDRSRAVCAGIAFTTVVGSAALVVDLLSYILVRIANTNI